MTNPFTEGMNLSYSVAMDQMSEVIEIGGNQVQVIADPLEKSTQRIPGGKASETDGVFFVTRESVIEFGIAKGDKVNARGARLRVQSIDDDGTDLITLLCGPPLKATIPMR